MYRVDHQDHILALPGAPPPSVGAPLPVVLATENHLLLAYLVEMHDPAWDDTIVRGVDPSTHGELAALIEFLAPHAHFFGPPNDEAFTAHPLAERGLVSGVPAIVGGSSWIRDLERMNRVHPQHRSERYMRLQHFVFPFRDSTFECIAKGMHVVERAARLAELLPEMQRRISRRSAAT